MECRNTYCSKKRPGAAQWPARLQACPRSISAIHFPILTRLPGRRPRRRRASRRTDRPRRLIRFRGAGRSGSGANAWGQPNGRISFSPSSLWQADSSVPVIFLMEPTFYARRADGRVNIFIRARRRTKMRLTSVRSWLSLWDCRFFPMRKQNRKILVILFRERVVYFRFSRRPAPAASRRGAPLPASLQDSLVRLESRLRDLLGRARLYRALECRLRAAMI
jgi:hypothetical protein